MCDAYSDCHDGSDEWPEVCENWGCTVGHWKCADNVKCIYDYVVCDSYTDCYDGSDEVDCANWKCAEGWWKCADNLQCLDDESFCDGRLKYGCHDGSDEWPEICERHVCREHFTKCADFTCIQVSCCAIESAPGVMFHSAAYPTFNQV